MLGKPNAKPFPPPWPKPFDSAGKDGASGSTSGSTSGSGSVNLVNAKSQALVEGLIDLEAAKFYLDHVHSPFPLFGLL